MNQRFAARGIAEPRAQSLRQDIRHPRIKELHGRIHGVANLLRAKRANGFVNRHDAPDFSGIHLLAAQQFHLRIHHFQPRGPQFIHFRLAMKNQRLPGLQSPFEIAAMEKLARQQAAGVILHEQVIDGVAAAHGAHRLAAHHARANGVNAVGLDVLHFGEMNAVFVAKRQIAQEILERVDAALRQQFGALRPDAFDHANFRAEAHPHF